MNTVLYGSPCKDRDNLVKFKDLSWYKENLDFVKKELERFEEKLKQKEIENQDLKKRNSDLLAQNAKLLEGLKTIKRGRPPTAITTERTPEDKKRERKRLQEKIKKYIRYTRSKFNTLPNRPRPDFSKQLLSRKIKKTEGAQSVKSDMGDNGSVKSKVLM